jgi:predicted amidophosphoribosyltransferase
MDHATHWSVDKLAASNLLAQLKIDASDDLIDLVTRHFSEHRRNLVGWAAERTQSAIIEAMESAAASLFTHRDEQWTRGFSQAEEIIYTLEPKALLDLDPGAPRSQGQILRSMVRQARRS